MNYFELTLLLVISFTFVFPQSTQSVVIQILVLSIEEASQPPSQESHAKLGILSLSMS